MDDIIWEIYRKEARELAVKRDESFRKSQIAYKQGDGLKAKQLSEQGKRCQKLCVEANKSAADEIFNYNNNRGPLTEIDLHGLYTNEAIEMLEHRIVKASNHGVERLDVIVGQGNHSENGPKIKPSVKAFAADNNIRYTINNRNPGCISLYLNLGIKPYRSYSDWTIHENVGESDRFDDDIPLHVWLIIIIFFILFFFALKLFEAIKPFFII